MLSCLYICRGKKITGKVIAGITAGILAAGGITAVVLHNKDKDVPVSTSVSVTAEESKAETTTTAFEAPETDTETTVTEAPVESAEESAAEETTKAEEPKDEERCFKWKGLKVPYPSDLEPENRGGYFYARLRDGFDVKKSMVLYSYVDDEIDSMTPESVMEKIYTHTFIHDIVGAELKSCYIDSKEVDSEESVHTEYGDFIKQKGIYHLDNFTEEKDVVYVGYFGILETPDDGKYCAVIIAMSEDMDDASKAEIEKIVDTALYEATPIEK